MVQRRIALIMLLVVTACASDVTMPRQVPRANVPGFETNSYLTARASLQQGLDALRYLRPITRADRAALEKKRATLSSLLVRLGPITSEEAPIVSASMEGEGVAGATIFDIMNGTASALTLNTSIYWPMYLSQDTGGAAVVDGALYTFSGSASFPLPTYAISGTVNIGYKCTMTHNATGSAFSNHYGSFLSELLGWVPFSSSSADSGSCPLPEQWRCTAAARFDPFSHTCAGSGGDVEAAEFLGATCRQEYVYLERSTDGGMTWTVYWEGDVIICE